MATEIQLPNNLPPIETTGQRPTMSLTQQIRAELNKNGVVNTSRFSIEIAAPRVFQRPGADIKSILLACTNRGASAVLPGIQINAAPIRRYGVGLEERKPTSATVIDQSFTFISDRDAIIHDFFYLWINSIVTSNKFRADERSASSEVDASRYPGSVLYKNEYATTITVYLYNEKDNVVHQVSLFNAFPVGMDDIRLGWGDSDQFMQIPVTFTYTHWRSELFDLTESQVGSVPGTNAKDLLFKAGSAALLLSTLKKPSSIEDTLGVINNAKTILGGFNFTFGK